METYDILAQQEELARRRLRLDQDQELSARRQNTPNGGGWTGLAGALAAAVRGRRAKSAEAEYATDARANKQAYSEQLTHDMTKYADLAGGRPADPTPAVDGVGPMRPAQAPDQRAAVMQALLSQMPELRKIGMEGLAGLGKQQGNSALDYLKLSGDYSPESRIQAAINQDPSRLAAMPKHTVINGQLVTEPGASGAVPRVAGDFRDQFKTPGQVGTDPSTGKPMLGQETLGTGEVKFAPAGTNISLGIDNVGNKEALGQAGKVMEGARNGIISAQQSFASSERLYSLMSDPQVISGFASNIGLGLASIGSKLGIGGADSAAKTQAAMAEMAQMALKMGEQMKGSFSNQDIIFLKEAASSNINFDAATIKRMAGLVMASSHNAIMTNNDQLESSRKVPGASAISLNYPTPVIKHSIPFDTDSKFVPDDQTGRVTYRDLSSPAAANAKPGSRKPTVSNWGN